MNLVRVINEVIDLDEVASWKLAPKELSLYFRNGTAIAIELRDQKETEDLVQLLDSILDKKTEANATPAT